MEVSIGFKTAEIIAEYLPKLSEVKPEERIHVYKFFSAIERSISLRPFRPSEEDFGNRKIACIKAWRSAFQTKDGIPSVKESKEAVDERDWLEFDTAARYERALEIFGEADITLEYKS